MSCFECKYCHEWRICDLFDDTLPYEKTCFMEQNKYEEDKRCS